jgi:hypothetical protein
VPDRTATPSARSSIGLIAVVLLSLTAGRIALAYGPEGHLIAGQLADDLLCERARTEIAVLGDGQDLGELGLWADRIRSDPAYADSAPWHYMNIADGEPLADFQHPPEGDVLWAIDRFAGRLRDESLGRGERAEALKFLVHFIVDLHQPLHVGLADDRGGNSVRLRYRGEATNLHRLWDTHAIEWADLSFGSYRRRLRQDVLAAAGPVSLDPLVWAEESLALRPAVYDFGEANREPNAAYMAFAASTTRGRLAAAARRLAGTLNATFCVGAAF